MFRRKRQIHQHKTTARNNGSGHEINNKNENEREINPISGTSEKRSSKNILIGLMKSWKKKHKSNTNKNIRTAYAGRTANDNTTTRTINDIKSNKEIHGENHRKLGKKANEDFNDSGKQHIDAFKRKPHHDILIDKVDISNPLHNNSPRSRPLNGDKNERIFETSKSDEHRRIPFATKPMLRAGKSTMDDNSGMYIMQKTRPRHEGSSISVHKIMKKKKSNLKERNPDNLQSPLRATTKNIKAKKPVSEQLVTDDLAIQKHEQNYQLQKTVRVEANEIQHLRRESLSPSLLDDYSKKKPLKGILKKGKSKKSIRRISFENSYLRIHNSGSYKYFQPVWKAQKLLPYAKNIPEHILLNPLFSWMFKEDPRRELELESQDLGGFRVNNSDESILDFETEENILDKEWFDELYTDSSLDSITDKYYYFVDYKDYVARLGSKEDQSYIISYEEERDEDAKIRDQENIFPFIKGYDMNNQIDKNNCNLNIPGRQKTEKACGEKIGTVDQGYYGADELALRYILNSRFGKDCLLMSQEGYFSLDINKEPGREIPVNSLSSFLEEMHLEPNDFEDPQTTLAHLEASLSWAAIYTETINELRARLLVHLSTHVPSHVFRWYPRIVEAIISRRINTKNDLKGFIHIISDLQNHKLVHNRIYAQIDTNIDNYCFLRRMRKRVFSTMYRKMKIQYYDLLEINVPSDVLIMLYNIATRYYRSGLRKYVCMLCDLIAKWKFNNVQIAAAIIKIISTPYPKIEDIVNWCGVEPAAFTSDSQ